MKETTFYTIYLHIYIVNAIIQNQKKKKKMDFVNLLIEINTTIDFLFVPIPPPLIYPIRGNLFLAYLPR